MTADPDPLLLDLLEWVAARPRPYAEVMEAWRTSCPRLIIWEDAVDQGLVVRAREDGIGAVVHATPTGLARLESAGRAAPRSAATTAG